MWKGDLTKAGISSDGVNIDILGNLTALGVPVVGTTFGNAYFVDYRNGLDTNPGTTRDKAFKTLSAAVAAATTNNNDVIFIDGDSTVVETAMVTISKNRLHIVGCNGLHGHYGAGAKISCALTTGASNIATVKNTGVRNSFYGIKFMNSNTVDEGLYAFVEGGEYTRFFNCEFYKETDLDVTGAADFVANGDSMMMYNCTIGSSANAISGAIIRANVLFTKGLAGSGKVARDNWFENCILWRRSSNAANRFVYGANATDIERFCVFKSCLFANAKNAGGVPAQNVAFNASLTVGEVLLWDCASMNAATAMSTTTGVFIQGYTPDATGAAAGIAIQAA
jgi:hypothetical protein